MTEVKATESVPRGMSERSKAVCFNRSGDFVGLDRFGEKQVRTSLACTLTWMEESGVEELVGDGRRLMDWISQYKVDKRKGVNLSLRSFKDEGVPVKITTNRYDKPCTLEIFQKIFCPLSAIEAALSLYHEIQHIKLLESHPELKDPRMLSEDDMLNGEVDAYSKELEAYSKAKKKLNIPTIDHEEFLLKEIGGKVKDKGLSAEQKSNLKNFLNKNKEKALGKIHRGYID